MLWKKDLGWWSSTVLFINYIAAFLILVSYLAPFVHPKSFWLLAFFGMAYPFLLIINSVFILFWVVRKPKWSVLSLFAIFLGWNTLNKTIGFSEKATNYHKEASALRLMSYNVHLFKALHDEKESTRKEFLSILEEVNPDVICLQKFYTQRKGKENIQSILINKYGYKHYYFEEVAGNEFDAYGIAIFSKLPILNTGSLDINLNERNVNRIQYVDLRKDSSQIRVYNVHLQSVGFQQEDYQFISQEFSTMQEDIASTKRIGGRLKDAFIKRSEQVDLLYDDIESYDYPYIIAGDFNDTPSSYAVNRIAKNSKIAFHEKGRGWGVTYNGAFPNFQIDYIMTSADFDIHKFKIISEKISDHYPIWSDLDL